MGDLYRCLSCPRVLRTSQGLKSHVTRLHKIQKTVEERLLSSQPSSTNSMRLLENSQLSSFSSRSESEAQGLENPHSSSDPLVKVLANLKQSTKILRRIPKGARAPAADCLTVIIDECLRDKSVKTWERLLLFTAGCFHIPYSQKQRNVSLATLVRQNIDDYKQGKLLPDRFVEKKMPKQMCEEQLAKIVEAKIADGDVRGAVRVLCSEDTFAPQNSETLSVLIEKHPAHIEPGVWPSDTPEMSTEQECLQVTESDVRGAISSFPRGSGGGLDMLLPQHLKDLVNIRTGNAGSRLLTSLTSLCNVMLKGGVPVEICPVLYGASLCALKKKCGGIRPIAVGNTLRRLVAKVCSNHVKIRLGYIFQPVQLGFGTMGGAEAAAHAARRFVSHQHEDSKVLLKIDFLNAFNMVRRDCILQSANNQMPEVYSFLSQCYRHPSHLVFGEHLISSQRGIQQGDPLGPALFCMVVHSMAKTLKSELNIWYLDDATLGGDPQTVFDDFNTVRQKSADIGLELNISKCEYFVLKDSDGTSSNTQVISQQTVPGIQFPRLEECTLLGAPLTAETMIECIESKTRALDRITNKLSFLQTHVAYYVLRHSLAIPKLSYVLRCAPTWNCDASLEKFDTTLRSGLEFLSNINLLDDAWEQAALPVSKGGLGLRHTQKLALPAFLSSVSSVSELVEKILPRKISEHDDPVFIEGLEIWCTKTGMDPPAKEARAFQKTWESPGVDQSKNDLYERAATPQEKARLLSVSSKESGAFLNALPSAPLGTLLNDDEFRISVGLRLGCRICEAHTCVCGRSADEFGSHGLRCAKTIGRRSRHAAVNDIIKRSLASANIPSILEPSYLESDNNRRPDGVTQIPWSEGKSLVWDFTCTDSTADSYVRSAAVEPLYAATLAEENKRRKYAYLSQSYTFTPIAAECLGSFGTDSLHFLRKLGKRITETSGEIRSTEYLLQRLSIAIQKGNAASVRNTIPKGVSMDDFLEHL